MAGPGARIAAQCRTAAHRGRTHGLTRPGTHTLSGGPAGDAGHAGDVSGHGGHAQWRGVCAGRHDRSGGHARSVLRTHQGLGPGIWHLGGGRGFVGFAGPDVGGESSRKDASRTAARYRNRHVTAWLLIDAPAPGSLPALQAQSQALPAVVNQLQAMVLQMERMGQQLNDRLISNQENFHSQVQGVYTELALSVDKSLRDSLSQSAQIAGESMQPVVQTAMAGISHTRPSTRTHGGGDTAAAQWFERVPAEHW